MVRWLASFFLVSIPCSVFAQTEKPGIQIRGTVIDSVTHKGIPDVHVSTPRFGTISENDGTFSLSINEGETLFFTHINYRAICLRIRVGELDTMITVSMREQVRILRPVTVSDILSEEGMKTRILETERRMSCEEQNTIDNSRIINSLGKIAPLAAPTREERFFQQLLGPQDVSILSSNPNRGIIKAIRNLTNPETPRIYKPKTRNPARLSNVNPFKVQLHPADSARRDTTEVVLIKE